jgi:hypothetical protein
MQGRTALYGRRHLLQLVAIKRLQGQGLSLGELQQRLLGLPNMALESVARLPANLEGEVGRAGKPEPPAESQEAFWKRTPPASPDATVDTQASRLMQGVPLGEGLLLLVSTDRRLEPDDIEALRAVAAPLVQALQERRLLQPGHERSAP